MSDEQSFVCESCGERHEGLPTDYGFRLPDEVHALSYLDRYVRSRSNQDLCTLDGSRYFIRGVLALPLLATHDEFCWGVWVEISQQHHDRCVAMFEADGHAEPRFMGRVANDMPGYRDTMGLSVEVQLQEQGQRPAFYLPAGSSHALAHEQREGISSKRHHSILESTGFFKDKDCV